MGVRKYYQRTGKKITINGSDTAGYDKSKVECFNFHKMGHFARECRSPRNQDNRPRNQDSSRKTMNVEETSSKAMIAIDGADSEVLNDKSCTNTYLKNYKTLKTQYDNLRTELNKSEFDLATYKRGLAYVEEQLVFYKKNEVMLCDQIVVLKRDTSFKDLEINALNIEIEKLKKEKESNEIKIDNFENASKSLDILIVSQITDNSKKGVGFANYNAVAPPPTGLFAPPTVDLSNYGLEEFQQPEFEGYGVKVSDCDEDESDVRVLKSDNVKQKPKQANQPKKVGENPRNNRTNWNEKKTQKLGMVQKPVMNNVQNGTGQREVRPVWNNAMRVNHQNFSNSRRNFAPTAVLTKAGLVPIGTARQSSSRVAAPVSTAKPVNTDVSKPFMNAVLKEMCDRKNSVFFTKTECLFLSPDFKLSDESQVMLKIPRKDNMYSFDLKNIVPSKGLTCLFAKATNDESKMWHRRLG
ncbi:ribonuclease H-like domain-containing protein, partial [Tanacetum coccineum]